MSVISPTVESFGELRLTDLIAKLAGVTLKDTIKVMVALDIVAWYFGWDAMDAVFDYVPEDGFDTDRPASGHVAACESAYHGVRSALKKDHDMRGWYQEMRNL